MAENHFTYDKISESVGDWTSSSAGRRDPLAKEMWIVTEKVHGANFSVSSKDGGQSMIYSKRKAVISDNEEFFGYSEILDRYSVKFTRVFSTMVERRMMGVEPGSHIIIYGELFGGLYPHEDVPADSSAARIVPIQTGIYYSPKLEFYAFDIATYRKGRIEYMNYDNACSLFQEVDLLYAEILFRGDFRKAMDHKIRFTTTIPGKLGYPQIEGNFAEGIVIKPVNPLYVETRRGKERAIIKAEPQLKIEDFAEDKRFHGARQEWAKRESETAHEKALRKEELQTIRWEAESVLTQQRVDAAISKVGLSATHLKNVDLLKEKAREVLIAVMADIVEALEGRFNDVDKLLAQRQEGAKSTIYKEIEREAKEEVLLNLRIRKKSRNA